MSDLRSGGSAAPCAPVAYRYLTDSFGTRTAPVQIVTPVLNPEDPVLLGRLRQLRLRSGMDLHATDAIDVHDLTTRVEAEPALTVTLFLRGHADVSLGARRHQVDARRGPRLFIRACCEPDLFVRRGVSGNWVRKISIGVPRDWVAGAASGSGEAVRRFTETHGASAIWDPTRRQVELAERILATAPFGSGLESLFLESHAFEIVAEALVRLSGGEGAPGGGVCGRDRARVQAVCEFLDAHEGDSPRLDEVARHAGMSVSTLQRLFRAVHGTSVFDYYRCVRMDRARAALEREGVSVTEAAFVAGYGNPANFATAFRRRFGLPPGQVRGRPGILTK
ncbi:helix-turn-helix transcriptional regulator [Azospirillum halopraeferens]|uniref:helix-turn-helix transcriptional regulator n=1 Tax=Azospirillum halopraeferens TaxID=34010 RepID=UPI0004174338|nr:AraC family transcriptional regulator [Azospirillum halopraeferens]